MAADFGCIYHDDQTELSVVPDLWNGNKNFPFDDVLLDGNCLAKRSSNGKFIMMLHSKEKNVVVPHGTKRHKLR